MQPSFLFGTALSLNALSIPVLNTDQCDPERINEPSSDFLALEFINKPCKENRREYEG